MPELVYLNGEIMDFASARVPVEDRGYQFGDGIYEVVRCYNGRPFALLPHLERLYKSAAAIEIPMPHELPEMARLAVKFLEQSEIKEAELYIQITRGVAPRRHQFPEEATPTVVMTVRPVRLRSPEVREKGAKVITLPEERWANCYIKTINLLPNIVAKEKAVRQGAFEALFVDQAKGIVIEGSSSNVFAVAGGVLWTPPADRRILSGITRSYAIAIAREEGYEVREEELPLTTLLQADEVFLTSTVTEMAPVIVVDETVIGNGQPGETFGRIYRAYQELYTKETS
ncbi:MAG: D-amino acid aminotransferase [Bacillota bacterium]